MNFKTTLLDEASITRIIKRISHEIIEHNEGIDDVVLVGIKTRGIPLAKRIQNNLFELEHKNVQLQSLDITLYRDDLSQIAPDPKINADGIELNLTDKKVILCDDVLYTGRTARAAIDAILSHGRPKQIQLAILIDRGHRELPIRADYIGKNIPTSHNEVVSVKFVETDSIDRVDILTK